MRINNVSAEELPVSRTEEVFDFRNLGFRQYMALKASRGGPNKLRHARDAMANSGHPLVVYAAGWAAAELALHRTKPQEGRPLSQVALTERIENLKTAQTLWASVGPGMNDLRESQPSQDRQLRVRDINVRRRQAIAYLPLMEVGAAVLAYEPYSRDHIEWYRHHAWGQSVAEADNMLFLPSRDRLSRETKAGLIAEAICGLIGQQDARFHHLVLPASFRQDNGVDKRFRADFLALDTKAPHCKTPMFVNWSERAVEKADAPDRRHGVEFVATRDFRLGPDVSPRKTLEALIALEAGTAEPEQQIGIEGLAVAMTDRLDAFRQRHDT